LRPHGSEDLDVSPRDAYADSRRKAHDEVSRWLEEHRPESRGATILTDEIGVIGYRLADWRVVDEAGMTDPEFSVDRIYNWPYYVQQERPDFIIRNYVHNQPEVWSLSLDGGGVATYQKIHTVPGSFMTELYERKPAP
jgi:hypothetical protein